MTVSEFRMTFKDLASQADILYQTETGSENEEVLKAYKEQMLAFSRSINELLDKGQPVTPGVYREIMEGFQRLYAALKPFVDIHLKFMKKQLRELQNLEAIIANVDVTAGQTLEDAVNNTLERVVRLKSDPDYMGAVSSQRFMVKVRNANGSITEGFFTRERPLFDFDPEGIVDRILDKAEKDHGSKDPELKEFVELVRNSPYGSRGLLMSALSETRKTRAKLKGGNEENLKLLDLGYHPTLMKLLILVKGDLPSFVTMINGNRNITELLTRVRQSFTDYDLQIIGTEFNQYNKISNIGIDAEDGSTRTGRNYALFKVAQLLGAQDVVAKSMPMTAEFRGNLYRGVFMEKAPGTCFDSHDKRNMMASELGRLNETSFDGEALRQLAKLQIVDYICQNVDRHTGNFLVKVDSQGKVTKVTGIDNDLCFGQRMTGLDKALQNSVPLDCITVIPVEMKEIIDKMDPDILKGVLADTGLSDREIQCAADRLMVLKAHLEVNGIMESPSEKDIEKGIRKGKVKVIPRDEWQNLKIDDLRYEEKNGKKDKVGNLFLRAGHIKDRITEWKTEKVSEVDELIGNIEENGRIKKYTKADNNNLVSSKALTDHQNKLNAYLEKFDRTEARFQTMHKPYGPMKKLLKKLVKENLPENMTQWERVTFENNLKELEKRANAYVTYKMAENDMEENGKIQLKEARALAVYLKSYRESFHEAYNEKMEAELEEINNEYLRERKEDQIANAIAKGFMKNVNFNEVKVLKAVGEAEDAIRSTEAFKTLISTGPRGDDGDTNLNYYNRLAEEHPEQVYADYLKENQRIYDAKKKKEAEKLQVVKEEGPVAGSM